ncbi:MAG: hypothetical protein WAQ98_33290 [Blastocatellia bacterium]
MAYFSVLSFTRRELLITDHCWSVRSLLLFRIPPPPFSPPPFSPPPLPKPLGRPRFLLGTFSFSPGPD